MMVMNADDGNADGDDGDAAKDGDDNDDDGDEWRWCKPQMDAAPKGFMACRNLQPTTRSVKVLWTLLLRLPGLLVEWCPMHETIIMQCYLPFPCPRSYKSTPIASLRLGS